MQMSPFWESLTTIALAITGVAMVAVIVSRNAKTAEVFQAGASGFSNALGVAVSPVTGNRMNINTSYPGSGSFGGLSAGSFGGGAISIYS